jgi:hypothetical protein
MDRPSPWNIAKVADHDTVSALKNGDKFSYKLSWKLKRLQYISDFLYLMDNFIDSLYCDVAAESQNSEVREDGRC